MKLKLDWEWDVPAVSVMGWALGGIAMSFGLAFLVHRLFMYKKPKSLRGKTVRKFSTLFFILRFTSDD